MVQFVNNLKGVRYKSPADKAKAEGKPIANRTTGPNFQGGIQDAWRGTLDENPLQNDFYQSAYTFQNEAPFAQQNLNDLRFVNTGNFEEGNNDFANNFLMKYSRELGGADSAEDKALIAKEDMVTRFNLDQISDRPVGFDTEFAEASQPAASGNAIVDSNVAGKFPSQDVNV
tara:strand:+ start:146 stop:661 length:516 start_codon:yes stop_codon:yes gene_type:complete